MPSHSPLNRNARCIESYIAYEAPVILLIEDAEAGIEIAYEDSWADELFTWFSSGRTLLSFCQLPGHPARSRILTWLNDKDFQYEYLRDKYEKGLINRAIALVDEAGDVAEEPLLMGPKGFLDPISMADKKQRVDAKLRLAALLDPAKYAPMSKTAQSIALTQVNITQKNASEMTDEQLLRVISELERRKDERAARTANVGRSGGDSGQGTVGQTERPQLPS